MTQAVTLAYPPVTLPTLSGSPPQSGTAASLVPFRLLLMREALEKLDSEAETTSKATQGRVLGNPPTANPQVHATGSAHSSGPAPTNQRPSSQEDDPLDPLNRHRAALAPPESLAAITPVTAPMITPMLPRSVAPEAVARARSSLEDLIPALVRRVAWSGDSRRGTARLEIGSGELSGATLLVHADAGRVHVQLDVPAGIDAQSWQRRIAARLASRSIPTDGVEVT